VPEKLRIGKLDQRIEIQQKTAVRSATGSATATWSTVARVWAGLSYQSSGNSEQVEADQILATTRVAFTIRYRDGLSEEMRIVSDGKNYDIIPPMEQIGRKMYLKLRAELQE